MYIDDHFYELHVNQSLMYIQGNNYVQLDMKYETLQYTY